MFDSKDIPNEFGKRRKPFFGKGMKAKRKKELVDKGVDMIMNGSLQETSYKYRMNQKANTSQTTEA